MPRTKKGKLNRKTAVAKSKHTMDVVKQSVSESVLALIENINTTEDIKRDVKVKRDNEKHAHFKAKAMLKIQKFKQKQKRRDSILKDIKAKEFAAELAAQPESKAKLTMPKKSVTFGENEIRVFTS